VALLASSPGCEWLASADLAGAVNIFSLDGLYHHASVPVGRGRPTAITFDSSGQRLVTVTSAHTVTVFDVESQSLAVPAVMIPRRFLSPQARVCGIAVVLAETDKFLLWGHNFMLALNVKALADNAAYPYPWRLWAGIRHVLALFGLRQTWGHVEDSGKRKRKREGGEDAQAAAETAPVPMVLSMEVTPEAAVASLPTPFERKKYQTKRQKQR